MRQITASAVKPGMTIEWSELGIKYTCVVSSIEPARSQISQEIMASGGGEATLYNNTMVTVLSEPQPEEPQEFGARVRVRDGRFVRLNGGDPSLDPWYEEGTGYRWAWDDLCEMGPVTVIPDQGWTVPDDTPEVPERIEEWPEDDSHLREQRWRDREGAVWSSRDGQWGYHSFTMGWVGLVANQYPFDGPWDRVTDA